MTSQGKKPQASKKGTSGNAPQQPRPLKTGKKEVSKSENLSLLDRLDHWIGPQMPLIFIISLILTILFGILLFDVKISTGGDDSGYIEMASNFINGRAFPSWHGPLYPIFLSLPMLIFGVKVVLLKLFSFVFIIGHLVLFYFAFRRFVSPSLLALVMLIVSVNSTLMYFASQTYSEAMYMFLQSLVVLLFLRAYQVTIASGNTTFKDQAFQWLITGFFVFLASLTRNIGIIGLFVMVLYLLIEKQWKASVMLTMAYAVFLIPFRIYKSMVWDAGKPEGTGQFTEILLKNPYNKAQGVEDFSGMIVRFFENARLYLSKHFMISLGLHDPFSTDKSWLITVIIIGIFLMALYFAFKKSRIMLFVALYLGASVSATFFALQQSWDQIRMVIIYIPMLLLFLAWGIQQLAARKGFGFLYIVLPGLLILIFFKTLGLTVDKAKSNQKVLKKNLAGNLYYGFTPDWQNFLLMSEWVGQHVPDTAVVASRKPSMSYIYSKGRDFYGIYRFPTEAPEKLVTEIRARTGELLVIPNKELEKNLPVEVLLSVKAAAVAYVAEGSDIYGVYQMQEPHANSLQQALVQYKLTSISSDSLLTRVKVSSQSCFAVSPDSLINTLKKNKVDYVIVASLRANPNMNTGNVINNIQRYLYFVEQKYPGILTLVHQIGASDAEEPAWLYKLNYNLYGL